MTRWNVKMRSWHAFALLVRKPRWHASTLARRPPWHIDQVGTQESMARDLASSSGSNFMDVYLLLELFFVHLQKIYAAVIRSSVSINMTNIY